MTTASFSLAPLFRHSIGFDRFNDLFERAFERESPVGYPPYNIEKHGENEYRIVLAVAGFTDRNLQISVEKGVLTIAGSKPNDNDASHNVGYMHQGIAQRSFKLSYRLEDHIEVRNANLENGLLTIDLLRVIPEEAKPRQIPISSTGHGQSQIEQSVSGQEAHATESRAAEQAE